MEKKENKEFNLLLKFGIEFLFWTAKNEKRITRKTMLGTLSSRLLMVSIWQKDEPIVDHQRILITFISYKIVHGNSKIPSHFASPLCLHDPLLQSHPNESIPRPDCTSMFHFKSPPLDGLINLPPFLFFGHQVTKATLHQICRVQLQLCT